MKTIRHLLVTASIALLAVSGALAQTPEVSFSENFQSYKTQSNPPGWIDNSIGNPRPQADGLYKTWPDPAESKKQGNVVFGTKQSSGSPEGRNPRIGTFSTLSTLSFSGQGRFEYRGRILRTNTDSRIGLTFFSSYPQLDQYYLIGLWSRVSGPGLTMQLFGFGAGTITGTVDSAQAIDPNRWYRFLIQVDDADDATRIRARFWPEESPEPETFSIDAVDAAASRLRTGRLGLWAAVKGDAYIDDITAKSPVDHSAPTITLLESGTPLPDGAKFNRDAVPEIRVSDDLSAATFTATLDGQPYTSLTPVTTEGWHALAVTAVDGPRNVSTVQVNFLVDKTPPVVVIQEGTGPFPPGFFFNRDVIANALVTDVSLTEVTATLDGQAYTLGTPITTEGAHSIAVKAKDEVNWETPAGPIEFTIDKTAPVITFTSHTNDQLLSTAKAAIAGGADDSVTLTVAGTPAIVAANGFRSTELALLEGENAIVATGVDRAGNIGTASLRLFVDTRGPALTFTSPNADACIDTQALQVSGSASDARLDSVKVTVGTTIVAAAFDAAGNWTASVPVPEEGRKLITVEAIDKAGHSISASRTVVIDRTAPAIEVRANGAAFESTITNRPVALFVSSSDSDATVTVILDGAAYTQGTSVNAEGKHTVVATATDCAGHTAEKTVEFTIDLTPPAIRNFNPADGSTVGTMPSSISAVTDPDVVSVRLSESELVATPAENGAFTIPSVRFAEGLNRFSLVAADRAGNSATVPYSVTVKTTAPIVEIRESGVEIPANALFNRPVTPVIRSVDLQAAVSATLNGAPFTSGTTISADGNHTLRATATDSLGHSGTAEATFAIDRTAPVVKITSPAAGIVQTERIQVRGTAGDSVSARVNGQTVTLAADGSFVVDDVELQVGENGITAAGVDRAGNSGQDHVVVTRDDFSAGILLTYPPDRSRTNRTTTDVIGRLLSANRGTTVRIGDVEVSVDSTGGFRLNGLALIEGENTITATSTAANGRTASASTRVTVDLTPPALTILESAQPLADGARFAERAVVSLDASDSAGAVSTELTIDGSRVAAMPFTVSAQGGHSAIAVARDLAGNEARAERTFFIGTAGGGAGCALTGFDPIDGSVILASQVTLGGRSGGAIGVKVNGVPAIVADGSFIATVELPAEGANEIEITCTDGNGNPTGTPAKITLRRVTGDPTVTIDVPSEDFVSGQETIGVTGTVGAGVVSADVNGVAATINGQDSTVPRSYSVTAVRLADGLNVLVAHGRDAAGRVATASRRGLYIKDAPAISISSPANNTSTGSPSITVSGTWSDLDPATLALASGSPVQFTRTSDTAGTFVANGVPLVNGSQTIVVTGRDRLNRAANASVAVTLVAGAPSITITQPANHSAFSGASGTVPVTGTFQAAAGSVVDVNGVTAQQSGATYTAAVPFSTLPNGITPIVARVTEPSGASASAIIAVTQYVDAPRVIESFPPPEAVQVDRGALMLVLFSQPMDAATVAPAFRLEDSSGAPVSGTPFLDKDVLTFAPAALLSPGARYTLRVGTGAKNLAGTPIAAGYSASFTVAGSAPATPPSVTPISAAVCGESVTVSGNAAPGARVRLESGTLTLNTTAATNGQFSFTYPISGQSGFALVRVRIVGSDGGISPAAELQIRIDCSGPQVLNAAYDRTVNKLTVQFSEPVDPATLASAIQLAREDGTAVGSSATASQNLVTITPAIDLTSSNFSLSISTAVRDVLGNALVAPYTEAFSVAGGQPQAGDGSGFISGEVYDATTGRPLPGASIVIDVASTAPVTTSTDARGRYLARLREGAHTIKASLSGYTTVWREIVVPPGAGIVPIDIRLTRRGEPRTSTGAPITLTHGGDTAVTRAVELSLSQLASGRSISLTSVGGQALMGLLPLGWSPIASAEVAVDGGEAAAPLSGQLTFNVPASEITASSQNLTAIQFNAARDEWNVISAVVNVQGDGKVVLPIASTGAYALVYADKVVAPPLPVAGDVLRGVRAADAAAPALIKRDFTLDPPIVMPSGRAVATLRIEGASPAVFPSGTAVQAYIDEELRLADGSRLLDPPFATDLLLYRTLDGALGVANFHLAPSERAAQVVLEVGVDHIRVFPYPGRLDRGTLIGSEGGRVPADDKVSVDIPPGAVPEPLRATATALKASDLAAIGTVAGFRVVGGFHLTLQRATEPPPVDIDGDGTFDPIPLPELFVPARATFTIDPGSMAGSNVQVILAELLDETPYGRMMRLAVPMRPVDGSPVRYETSPIDRAVLPVDGVLREGRYVVLAAEAPIAFATGTVRLLGSSGRLVSGARVLNNALGVAELTRRDGIYNIPVPATPAGPFSLVPRHTTTGDGAPYTHVAAADAGAVVRADLVLTPQPPVLGSVVVLKGEPPSQGTLSAGVITRDVALSTNIRASFSPSLDPASVTAESIVVTNAVTNTRVPGSATADGTVAVVWTLSAGARLEPNAHYTVALSAIRGANGASARPATFAFATVRQVLNAEVNRDRIRISIPDANGISRIVGIAGALPAGWQAVAVRRVRDFNQRFQATAAGDGSFSFSVGNSGNPADKVTIADLIDLQVINAAGNLAAIFALTPFASEDGKSFVAPAGAAIRYTTPEGFTLDVPEGAFDVATVISMNAAKKDDFMDIPFLERENEYLGSVNIQFEGTANKPLGFEAPAPAGFDATGRQLLMVEKYLSSIGPRLYITDILKVENGKFVTDRDPNINAIVIGSRLRQGTTATLTGSAASRYLTMVRRSGIYMYLDIKVYGPGGSVGFGVMEGLQHNYDFIWSIYASYIIPHVHFYEKEFALLPLISDRPFTVTGIDPGTGLQAVKRTYDPVPFGEPGTVVSIPPAQQNDGGPYPVFGGPFRVEMLDLTVEDVEIRSIRNFRVKLSNDQVTVSAGDPVLEDTKVQLLNVSNGTMISGTADSSLSLAAKLGQRIVLLIEQHKIDQNSTISVVFSEPIDVGPVDTDPDAVDVHLRDLFKVEHAIDENLNFYDITPQVRFSADSGKRRIHFQMPSALQSEARYRITLKSEITDIVQSGSALKLGQGTVADSNGNLTPVGGENELTLHFDVRKPAGELNSFNISEGFIRGMELAGNVLIVAAGGLQAYDMSNPAETPAKLGFTPGFPEHFSVTVDRHNRVYATAMQHLAGVFRSYRVEDFARGGDVPVLGSTLINWKMGYSTMIGLPSNTVVSDRPESIPFRIKVIHQDDEVEYRNRELFVAGTGAGVSKQFPDDLQRLTVNLPVTSTMYNTQRITIENVSLDMKWSMDAQGSATFTDVIARSTDKLRVIRNLKTYAIVAHLGYGIGIYDANGIEHNRKLAFGGTGSRAKEQLVLTSGKIARECTNKTPDHGIIDNYITTDADLGADTENNLFAYFTDNYRGILDLYIALPSDEGPGTLDDDCDQRSQPNTGGLLFRSTPAGFEGDRMKALTSALGGQAFGHFGQFARHTWSISAADNRFGERGTEPETSATRDYLLVAGHQYGLIVVDIGTKPEGPAPAFPLEDPNIADIIWIPGGAASVRVIPSANVAVVGDRNGRALIVDLSRLDERWDEEGNVTSGLFPTAARAIAGAPTEPNTVGAPDPRIIWMSPPGAILGSVPPVLDPHSGMLYTGAAQQVKIFSALDPRLVVKANLGDAGLSDVGGIVPLGVDPPLNIQGRIAALPACDGTTFACKENASLAAFRLEVALPGDMAQSLIGSNRELQLAVESERVADAVTEQTPDGFPRAHLRRSRRDGNAELSARVAANFKFQRIVPDEMQTVLRMQRGYNRFISPWIVAVADPRASEEYDWNGASALEKREKGCQSCERPRHLIGKTEDDGIYELWTNGRFVAVRPELNGGSSVFEGTKYAYLGREKRLIGRFTTVMADTVRPIDTLVAGQNAPVAGGAVHGTTFLHSGEIETTAIDLDAGGRNGFNVQFDRTYRSRTLGGNVFGQGWDSALLRRIRALPDGDVEYRDGSEVWRFVLRPQGGYAPPAGLFLRLLRTQTGWNVVDQEWGITEFDDLGRLRAEYDVFYDPSNPGSGNIVRYVYDEAGRLSQIVDPVNRVSTIEYWKESNGTSGGAYPGLVSEIVDWRDRKLNYTYDASTGTLLRVALPEVTNTNGGRPAVQYTYMSAGGGYSDKLELRTNLETITDPHAVLGSGAPRVRFSYFAGGALTRDHVSQQKWGSGETVSFNYSSPTQVTTTDALGQGREYTLTEQPRNPFADRAHITKIVETNVTISETAFGQLPATVTPGDPPTSSASRTFTFSYDGQEGLLQTEQLSGVYSTTYGYQSVEPVAPGFIPVSSAVTGSGGSGSLNQNLSYQSGPNRTTFLEAVSANGIKIDVPEPNRNYREMSTSNDNISGTEAVDDSGQLTKAAGTGGTDSASGGADTQFEYASATGPKHARSQAISITEGGLKTQVTYPSENRIVQTDPRGIVTSVELDTWQRPVHVTVTGPQLTLDERFEYDATGRLIKHIRKQGEANVTKTYGYDTMGRPTSFSIDHVGNGGVASRTVAYDLPGRTITTTHPGGSVTTATLDGLGRIIRRATTTGGTAIVDRIAYDLAGNPVYVSDGLTAMAAAFNAQGDMIGVMDPDSTSASATVDGFGRPVSVVHKDSAGTAIAQTTAQYGNAGRLQSFSTTLDGSRTRVTNVAWDGGNRTTGVSISGRAARATYDAAHRLKQARVGRGTANAVTDAFRSDTIGSHHGTLPVQATAADGGSGVFAMVREYNTTADAISKRVGDLEWQYGFDQDGNVTARKGPNRPAEGFQYDSRGSLQLHTFSGGSTAYGVHPTGALASYTDPANEVTETTNDLIGRPTRRTYRDGTSEAIEWEGRRIRSVTDRAGRLLTFTYNTKGQITEISGPEGVVDTIEYDAAGRIAKWTTPDSILEYSDFDSEGNPKKTSQSRRSNGQVLDTYSQEHTWNEHGERTSWTMPTYPGFSSSNGWTKSVTLERDAMGNITKLDRDLTGVLSGGSLLSARYRYADRPDSRRVSTPSGTTILRSYDYHPSHGLLMRMAATANAIVVAGSEVEFDGTQRMRSRLLGLSGGNRGDEWSYDGRSRLRSSSLGRGDEPAPNLDDLSSGDFRTALDRVPASPIDPPSVKFTEDPEGGHKISVVQRGSVVEQFRFEGGERREDGTFRYDYDVKGRLSIVTLKTGNENVTTPRRVRYFYDGRDRLIGRRLEYAQVAIGALIQPSDWKLEDRASILLREPLPPDATFVWDPIDDQLIAVFKAGSSANASIDDNGGLVRQIIHGGVRYDDPLEVAVADVNSLSGVSRLYPVYDEAGAKSLQVILNEKGEIVSRAIAGGSYGEDQAILTGPAVERVTLTAKKDADGNLESLDIEIRSTEDIAQNSVAAGFRVAAVDSSGAATGTTTAVATLADSATVRIRLTNAQWTALSAGGGALSVAATNAARGQAWAASAGILAAPQWATSTRPVFASAELPVEVRESLAVVSQWLASLPADATATTTLYEVASLYALGAPRVVDGVAAFPAGDPQALIISAHFHAHPFQDPFTAKNYVRARWFDVQTGTWLTPDPAGYRDSSNLYAYCGNDPVNCIDPTGESGDDDEDGWLNTAGRFAWGVTKTVAIGAAVTVGVSAAVVLTGASAPFVATVGVLYLTHTTVMSACDRYAEGHAKSAWSAGWMGLGDATGVNTGIEVLTGREMGTNEQLSAGDRAERAGAVIGGLVTGAAVKRGSAYVGRKTAMTLANVENRLAVRAHRATVTGRRLMPSQERLARRFNFRRRIKEMKDADTGYNVSSEEIWTNNRPGIGKDGTFITDAKAVEDVLGSGSARSARYTVGLFDNSARGQLSYHQIAKLERALGLWRGSRMNGLRITEIRGLKRLGAHFVQQGRAKSVNPYYLGDGLGLPGWGPEMIIKPSFPTSPWP